MAEENKTPLAIQDTAANPDKATTTLEVDGQSVALDALGPMIINSDGTISRITNWQELSELEKERTVRLLVKKRNLVRLNQLQKDAVAGEEKLSALQDQTK